MLGPAMTQYPTSFGMLLGAYERALTPPVEVAIVGPGHRAAHGLGAPGHRARRRGPQPGG